MSDQNPPTSVPDTSPPPDTPTDPATTPPDTTPPAETTPPTEPDTTTPPPPPPPTTSTDPTDEPQPTAPPDSTSTVVTVVTRTPTTNPTDSTPSSTSTTSSATPIGAGGGGSGGLSSSAKIAVAVVVPIAAVALLVFAAIWFYKRRKARKEEAEERRKEVEDYAYNPNADPTIPAVGLVSDERYEMREDAPSGYRGWGSTTAGGSTGRKASTTMSGGVTGEPLVDGSHHSGSYSPEGEILGQMGPSAAGNRGADVHRGPSNASSSYSAAARSDGSGDGGIGVAYGSGNQHYNQYAGGNPYADPMYNEGQQRPTELPGQPIIRDNPARRNTRIENPSHYPQQSAGISQNF